KFDMLVVDAGGVQLIEDVRKDAGDRGGAGGVVDQDQHPIARADRVTEPGSADRAGESVAEDGGLVQVAHALRAEDTEEARVGNVYRRDALVAGVGEIDAHAGSAFRASPRPLPRAVIP